MSGLNKYRNAHYMKNTYQSAGFVHKIRNHDTLKAVAIKPTVIRKKEPKQAIGMSIAAIRQLRVKDPSLDDDNTPPRLTCENIHEHEWYKHSISKNPKSKIVINDGLKTNSEHHVMPKLRHDALGLRQFRIKNKNLSMPSGHESIDQFKIRRVNDAGSKSLSSDERNRLIRQHGIGSTAALLNKMSSDEKKSYFMQSNPLYRQQYLDEQAAKEREKEMIKKQKELEEQQYKEKLRDLDEYEREQLRKQDYSDISFNPPRVMGIDYGKSYVGVAISSEDLSTSLPLRVITLNHPVTLPNGQVQNVRADASHIAGILNDIRKEYNVVCTAIGIPEGDRDEPIVKRITDWTQDMQVLNGLGPAYEVCFIDEHHSTFQAKLNRESEAMVWQQQHQQLQQHEFGKMKALQKHNKAHDKQVKGSGIDAEAAAVILGRFLEIYRSFGASYSELFITGECSQTLALLNDPSLGRPTFLDIRTPANF